MHYPTYNRHSALSLSMIVVMTITLLCSCKTTKQEYKIPEPKAAVVNESKAYQDKLQFPFDDKGMDLNVNIAFDEAENVLTLSLSATRQLMVFRQDVFYGMVFTHPFLKPRRLEPKKLPYPVLIQPDMQITLSKNVWKGFRKNRNQHIFNHWLVGVSPELKVIEPSLRTDKTPEATLIVDSIVQRFHVDPKATKASFTLRNFLVVDKDGMPIPTMQLKRSKSSSQNYQIVCEKDLNLTYNVMIQRNPCFGQDSLIAVMQTRIDDVMKAYTNLHEACPTGVVHSTQEQGIFNQHKKFLISQYPCINDSSACAALQAAYTKYNTYADSIAKAPCTYVKPLPAPGHDDDGMPNIGVRPNIILDAAHRIDNIVAQAMLSHDAAQIHDLMTTGEDIIFTITKAVREKGLINEDQRKAYNVFLKAKAYFKSTTFR